MRGRLLLIAFAIHSMAFDPAWGQTALGEVVGEIKDASGTVITKAPVTLTNQATGVQTSLVTNEAGVFFVRSLQPGVYRIEATSPGFKTFVATNVELRTGQVLRYDVVLQVGDVTQSVEVVSASGAVELQKDSGEVSSVLNSQTIKEMPSGTRKVLELVELTPGVTLTGRGSAQAQTLAFFSIAGNPGTRSNIYMLDGAQTSFPRAQGDGGHLPAVNPPTEVIEEIRVITNNYSAEFGQGIGGVMAMTSKSGTNQFRGDLYYFGQNDALNARNFFSRTVPPVRYNNFGFVIGGPIIKNKTHFLVNFEREINNASVPIVLTIPTSLQRQGNFSQTVNAQGGVVPVYDPATTRMGPGGPVRDQFPGNIIPASRFDPIAQNLLTNYVPDPNQPGTITGANNFLANRKNVDLHRNWQFYRGDHQLTSNDKLYGRVSIDRPYYPQNGPYVGTRGEKADPFDVDVRQQGKTVGAGYTRIISPTTLSDFRFGYVSFNMAFNALGRHPDIWQQNAAGQLGLKNLSVDTFPYFEFPGGFTGQGFGGYAAIGGSGGSFGGRQNLIYRTMRAFSFHETISHQRGKHNMRAGVEWKHSKAVFASRVWPSGISRYDERATAQPGQAATGNPIASFLLGQVASASIQDTPAADMRTWFMGVFFQDDWRVTNTLTLNMGVRYEYDRPKVDVKEYQNFFDSAKINPVCNCPGVVEFSADQWAVTQQNTPLYDSQPNNWAPGIGFAWTAKGDMVIRGGYGIFFTGPEYNDGFWDGPMAGRGVGADWSTDGQGITPAFILSQGYPNIPLEPLNDSYGAVPIGQLPRFGPRYWVKHRTPGYSQQANLSLQKQFGKSLVEIGYLGNASKHLPNQVNINEVRPELRGPGNAQLIRPFPQFGNVRGIAEGMQSSLYHAGLIAFRRHFSGGLSFQTNYTFSRFLDNAGYKRSDYDRKVDYGPSSLERRHRFVWSSVYELPWGPGKRYLQHGTLGNLLGGWLLGSFINLQTGPPVFISNASNTCNCFTFGTQGANASGPVARIDDFDPGKTNWFDTSVFSAPAPYTFGNAGRDLVYAPGLAVVNLNLTKKFQFGERYTVELRGEAFNFLNRANFNGPNATFGSPAFGRITSALDGRIVQYAARFLF